MPTALPLTTLIDQGSSRKRQYRTLRAEFGNGYEQTAPDGINAVRDEWSISYSNLTGAERTTLVTALDTVQGWDVLTWTAPGDVTQKKWKVSEGWSESTNGLHYTVSFTLRQCY